MIVPARVMPPLALLAALLSVTVLYNAGIAQAPVAFFGDREDLVLLLPSTGGVTSTGTVPEELAHVLRTREDVTAASPEIIVMTAQGGVSLFARGVDASAFLAIEDGRLTSGVLPSSTYDALAGVDLARRLRLAVGDRLLLPGSLAETAANVRVVGVFDAPGLPRDELLLSIPVARGLAGLAPGGVHLIRVRSSDPQNVTLLASSVQPTFTYSNVRLSADDLVLGQPTILSANVTNWGVVGGSQAVVAHVEDAPVGSAYVYVEARSTARVRIPIYLTEPGDVVVRVNPSFAVSVREPTAKFVEMPTSFAVGEAATFRLVDINGTPVAGAIVTLTDAVATSDAEGVVAITPTAEGPARADARMGSVFVATHEALVAPAGYADRPLLRPLSIASAPLVGITDTVGVELVLANVGGADGPDTVHIRVDGIAAHSLDVDIPVGERRTVQVDLAPLAEGIHRISVDGLDHRPVVESFPGDPRVEAALRAREAARANPTLAPRVGDDASAYVDRIVRNVAVAAAALTIAAGGLASLAVVAVWSRHLRERSHDIGVLKALGADREKALALVTRETLRYAGTATLIGVAAGVGLALALDATGFVRAFGHRVAPALGWRVLTVLTVATLGANLLIARWTAGSIYDHSAGALIGRQLLLPPSDETPTLAEVISK